MAEYVNREHEYPDEIGNTLNAFLGSLQKNHHGFIMNEVEFVKYCTELGSLQQKLEAGAIGAEQMLTLMQSIPVIEYCDDEGYGLDDSEIEMNMRVSASTKEDKKDEGAVDSDTQVEGHMSLGPFGGGSVKQKVHGHYSHAAEQAHESDYSAYTKLKVRCKRIKPPPARRLTSQLMQEFVKDLHMTLKSQMKRQSALLDQELADKDPPKSLPVEKKPTDGNGGTPPENSGDGSGENEEAFDPAA